MATFVKFDSFPEHLAEKVHKLDTDSLKIMLTNTAPVPSTNTVKGDLTEIGVGNGYLAGGAVSAQVSSSSAAGVYKLVLTDVTFTATGGSIGPFRYAILFNDTPSSPLKPLIAYWDRGASITLADGDTFTVDFNGTDGAFTIT